MPENFFGLPVGEVLQRFPHGRRFNRKNRYGRTAGTATCRTGYLLSQSRYNRSAEGVNSGGQLPIVFENM